MTYEEIIQKPGKQLEPEIYYFDSSNNKQEVSRDNFETAKLMFNSKIVGTVMHGLSLELKNELPNTDIYLKITAKYGTNTSSKTYGPYYFKENPTYNADTKTYTHQLYDGFVKTMIDYKPITISYPTTIFLFFNQLCIECGFTTNITSLPNGNRLIQHDIYEDTGMTYRDIFEDIGTASATLFKIDENIIKKCSFGQDATIAIINDDILKNTNISFGKHYGPINSIVLSRGGGADNIYKKDQESIETNGLCEFKISDNQLMNSDDRSDYLDDLLSSLDGINYDIFDTELVGYGGFTPLQKVIFQTNENSYSSYVFNNEIEITQGYKESIYTDMPDETETDYKTASYTDKTIQRVALKVDKQSKEIQALSEKTVPLANKVSGYGLVTIENAVAGSEAIDYIKITGDDSLLFPTNNLFSSSNLFLKNSFLYVNEGTENEKIYDLKIKALRNLNNIYDEYVIENNKATFIKRIGVNSDGSYYILAKEQVTEMGEMIISLVEGTNTMKMPSFMNTFKLDVTYLTKNIYTDTFATNAYVDSSITVASDEINLKVETKFDENFTGDNLISQINLDSTGNVTIDASRLAKLTANNITLSANDIFDIISNNTLNLTSENIAISSDNFSVDKNGNIIASNASFSNGEIISPHFNVDKMGNVNCQNLKVGSEDFDDATFVIGTNDNNDYNTKISNGYIRMKDATTNCDIQFGTRNAGSNNTPIPQLFMKSSGTGNDTWITSEGIDTPYLTQTSLAERKKDFELLENGLYIVNSTDIYKYHFKSQKSDEKKHIGFVIGNNFNYSSEITAVDSNNKEVGVDTYSMTAVAFKAIQELCNRVEDLQEEIKKLKESDFND